MCKKLFGIVIIMLWITSLWSCAVGTGCPAEKAGNVRFDRHGQLKTSKARTHLFPNH